MDDIELAGEPQRNESFVLRGLTSLPLRWTPRAWRALMELDAAVADPTGPKLLELGQAVARAATIDDMIRVVTDVAGPLVKATNATALLLDESRSKLVVYHGPAARTQGGAGGRPVRSDAGRRGRAHRRAGVPRQPRGAVRRATRASSRSWSRLDWAALAVLPLFEGGELFGVVVYRWMDPVEFTPARRELIETISELVGHALARARNHDHLVAYTRRLRESNRDLDSFAAAVAHDLRQPLRQLSSYIDVLFDHLARRRSSTTTPTHYAERIRGRRRAGRPADRRAARVRPGRRQADGRRGGAPRRRGPGRRSRAARPARRGRRQRARRASCRRCRATRRCSTRCCRTSSTTRPSTATRAGRPRSSCRPSREPEHRRRRHAVVADLGA